MKWRSESRGPVVDLKQTNKPNKTQPFLGSKSWIEKMICFFSCDRNYIQRRFTNWASRNQKKTHLFFSVNNANLVELFVSTLLIKSVIRERGREEKWRKIWGFVCVFEASKEATNWRRQEWSEKWIRGTKIIIIIIIIMIIIINNE